MQLLGYSERGFINAFFYGILHHPDPSEMIRGFLTLAKGPIQEILPEIARTATVDLVLIEQSFSDFGDADVLILVTLQEKAAFFCEAKRGKRWKLRTEWDQFKAQFQNDLPGGE